MLRVQRFQRNEYGLQYVHTCWLGAIARPLKRTIVASLSSSAMDGDDLVQEVPLSGKSVIWPKGTTWLSKLCRGAARKKKEDRRRKKQSRTPIEELLNKWKPALPMIHPDLGLDLGKLSPGARHWGTQSWLDSKVTSFCV